VYEQQLARLYVDEASLTAQYPLSPARRIEAGVSLNRQSFGVQSVRTVVVGGQVVRQDQSDSGLLPAIGFGQASLVLGWRLLDLRVHVADRGRALSF
jgi:hypothetical protein